MPIVYVVLVTLASERSRKSFGRGNGVSPTVFGRLAIQTELGSIEWIGDPGNLLERTGRVEGVRGRTCLLDWVFWDEGDVPKLPLSDKGQESS